MFIVVERGELVELRGTQAMCVHVFVALEGGLRGGGGSFSEGNLTLAGFSSVSSPA